MNFRRRPPGRPVIVLLVKWLASFSFVMCLLSLFLYIIGTRQEFMDTTQLLLLRILEGGGLVLTLVSLYGLILDSRIAFSRRRWGYLFGAGGYLLLGIFGAAAAFFAAFIFALAGGNIP